MAWIEEEPFKQRVNYRFYPFCKAQIPLGSSRRASTRHDMSMCCVVSRRDVTRQVEFGLKRRRAAGDIYLLYL